MVPGLEEAILGMRAGSRRRILVPPSQGYDEALKVGRQSLMVESNGMVCVSASTVSMLMPLLCCPQLGPAVPGFAARRQVINHRTESLVSLCRHRVF